MRGCQRGEGARSAFQSGWWWEGGAGRFKELAHGSWWCLRRLLGVGMGRHFLFLFEVSIHGLMAHPSSLEEGNEEVIQMHIVLPMTQLSYGRTNCLSGE